MSRGIYAHGFNMNRGNRHDVSSVLLVEVLEVRGVLEVVGVAFTAFDNGVRNNVVGENFDLKGYILGCKDLLDFFKNFGVRCRRCSYRDLC